MIVTKVFSESSTTWNEQLKKCCNFNVFSLYEWASYKSTSWHVERLVFYLENTYVGQTQILFKKMGPFKIGWCSSGVNLTNYKYLGEIIESLSKHYNSSFCYIRFNFLDNAIGETKFAFDEIPLLKSVNKTINSGYTIRFYDLATKMLDGSSYDRNTRYYLKKAKENQLTFTFTDLDVDLFCKTHDAMTETKGLGDLKTNRDDLKNLQKHFGNQLKMGLVKKDTEILAVCLLMVHGQYAYYFLAGSSETGRKLNASFLMVDQLLLHFKSDLQITEFDFGGITPFKENAKGVNRFKMGYMGTVVNYIGERVLCKNTLLQNFFDFVIYKKLN